MKYQKTYYKISFDKINNVFIYRTRNYGSLTTCAEDDDGLLLHKLTVTENKIAGYFTDNGDNYNKDIFIKLTVKDQFDKKLAEYNGALTKEANKMFSFDFDCDGSPYFYNQAIDKSTVDFVIEFEFKDDYDDFTIENLQELMIKHGVIIRAIPEYEINLLEPRYKDKYPDAEVIYDERYKRNFIRVETKLSLGKKFIVGIKHNQMSKVWDDNWIRDPKTKKILSFNNLEEVYNYLTKM